MTDALDIEHPPSLLTYLRRTGRVGKDETCVLRVLAGGVSNRTVLVQRPGGQAWVIKQALARLRVQADWFSDPARIHREALGLRWLSRLAPPGTVTPLVFEDHDHHLLAMAAVPEPHANWKTELLAGRLDLDHVRQFATLLGLIHRRGHEQRGEIEPVFADRTFFESLRLEPYYAYAAGRVPPAAPFLQALIDDCRTRRLTLVHGDYSPKNILIHDGRLVLLDHEVIHFGDPAFDLGFAMTHLLSKAHHLAGHRQQFLSAAREFLTTYRRALGDTGWSADLEPFAVRHTLGCLLARVDGRSPLEYLSRSERGRQRSAVLSLIADPPADVPALVEGFAREL